MATSDLILLPEVIVNPKFERRRGGPCTWSWLDPKLGEQSNSGGTHWITVTWYAVVQEFNLERHYQHMKHKHPDWTKEQIYADNWSSTVLAKLICKAEKYKRKLSTMPDGFCFDWACHLVENPEKHGVDVAATLAKVGTEQIVTKKMARFVVFVGIQKTTPQEPPVITPETPDCIWPYYRHNKNKCVWGKCACATSKDMFPRVAKDCKYQRPRIDTEIAYARENGFGVILQCDKCGKIVYTEKIIMSLDPNHPKCCCEQPRIIWLAEENKIEVSK